MNDTYYSDELLNATQSIFDAVKEAHDEALKRGIEANTIRISKRLAYMPGFHTVFNSFFGIEVAEMPPMIFGMEAYIASDKELPEGVGFEIYHSEYTAVDRIKEEARSELLSSMRNMSFSEIHSLIFEDDE